MNLESKLKLQAYLDGELAPAQLREITQLLAHDTESKALYAELRATRDLVRGNELEVKLTESREFYWSKITREIDRNARTQTAPDRTSHFSWLRRWGLPLGGVAALAGLLAISLQYPSSSRSAFRLAETIETAVDDSSMNSFRSESEGISVVWVSSR
jgi:anti-sigma factor RsiW